MTTKTKTILLLTLAALPIFTGCTAVSKPSAESRHYVIDLDDNTTTHSRTIEGTVRLRSFHIASPFQNTELVYRLGDVHYESDYYNRFFVSPSSIITEQTQKWITQSNLFENVAPSTSRALVHFSIEGEILSLYADLRNPDNQFAFMEIRFTIINEIAAQNTIVFSKTYTASTRIETIEPSKIIAAHKKSLQQILTKFLADLEKTEFPAPPNF